MKTSLVVDLILQRGNKTFCIQDKEECKKNSDHLIIRIEC